MKAVRVVRNGWPIEAIEVQDIDIPAIEPGMVRVAVTAASLNFGDIARCRGGVASVMMPPPFTIGMDVCGVVDAVNEGAEHWLGRRVVGITKQSLGGVADYALATATGVFDAPAELDDVEAAAFTLPFHTSYLALHRRAKLEAGEVLLVVGGATAVGTTAIQLGVAAGARVIAIAGGADKVQRCLSLGASEGLDYHTDDIFDRVMAFSDGRGADVVCDFIGGAQTETIWTCIAREGRYLPVGFNDDPESGLTGRPLRKVSTGNFSVLGVMVSYNQAPLPLRRMGINPYPPETGPQVHAALCELVTAGKIKPYIGRRITMNEVAAALEDHAQRRTTGRTVVDIAAS